MRSRVATVLVLALAVVGALTPGAAAETAHFPDGRSTPGPMDIHHVDVVNEDRLEIRVVVADLQRRTGRSASVWIDTDPGRRGPEFFIGSGLHDSDWQISRARRWRVVGDGPLPCPVGQRLRYGRDVIIWTTGSACLGDYGRTRVSVEARGRDVTDYSPRRHVFHEWVARR